VAKRRLRAELKVVGRPLVSTQLLVREGFTRKEIINQSDTAIYEIAACSTTSRRARSSLSCGASRNGDEATGRRSRPNRAEVPADA
jgi:hypothetical protein